MINGEKYSRFQIYKNKNKKRFSPLLERKRRWRCSDHLIGYESTKCTGHVSLLIVRSFHRSPTQYIPCVWSAGLIKKTTPHHKTATLVYKNVRKRLSGNWYSTVQWSTHVLINWSDCKTEERASPPAVNEEQRDVIWDQSPSRHEWRLKSPNWHFVGGESDHHHGQRRCWGGRAGELKGGRGGKQPRKRKETEKHKNPATK